MPRKNKAVEHAEKEAVFEESKQKNMNKLPVAFENRENQKHANETWVVCLQMLPNM